MTRLLHKIQRDKRRGYYLVNIRMDGVRKYFNLGTTLDEARVTLERLEKDIAAGRIKFVEQELTTAIITDGKKDMFIKELANRHLEWVHNNRELGTFRNRRNFVLQFLDFVGDVMVCQISRSKLEDFLSWAKTNKSRSENGGNEALAAVKAMFRWGEEMELIDLPFKRFPKLTFVPPELKRISDTDIVLLLVKASPDFRDFIFFGIVTGLRPKELRNLTVSQIRCTPEGVRYVYIQQHKTAKSARVYKPRSVPLTPEAERIVERQVKSHPTSQYIFLNEDGNPYTNWTLRNKFRRLCKSVGFPELISTYDLRHEFASRNSDNNVETTGLAQLMGHSTTRTLMRYVKNTLEAHRNAVNQIEKGLLTVLTSQRVTVRIKFTQGRAVQNHPPG